MSTNAIHDAIQKRLSDLEHENAAIKQRVTALEHRQNQADVVTALHAINANLAILTKEIKRMDQSLIDLKASFAAYAAKVDAYVTASEAFKATVDQLVAAAVAADDAEETIDMTAFAADIATAAGKVPDAPVPPPVEEPPVE